MRSRSPIIPSWHGTSLDSPITKVTIPLLAVYNNEVYPSGTACIIAPWLAVTARHVVEDHFNRFAQRAPATLDDAKHHTLSYILPGNDHAAIPLVVKKTWYLGACDLAILYLAPASETSLNHEWVCPVLSLLPPYQGSNVFAFGYPNSTFRKMESRRTIGIGLDATTTTGTVLEVHHDRRDLVRLSFPCFRTNARFDGGMSGGPVFDEKGHVCGIICSGLPPLNTDEQHASYASTLWPILANIIDAPWDIYPLGTKYPLYEFAARNIIKTVGLEHVTIEKNLDDVKLSCLYDNKCFTYQIVGRR